MFPGQGGENVRYLNTYIFLGLAVWIFGFALMVAGWLVDVIFEGYGTIPAKVLYKTGALIVGVPVIYLLWKISGLIYMYRLDIVLFLRDVIEEITVLVRAL
ncbi:MAG: hypothetical protein LBR61_00210 [Synergistaceae bacterium]|jgi:hypothetical protein|nr:hypothetical protein [Synergistaceae bacterium]